MWDAILRELYYAELADIAAPVTRSVPSMYSPDRLWFYASSVDEDARISDLDELQSLFDRIVERVESLAKSPIQWIAVANAFSDFCEVSLLLNHHHHDDSKGFPEQAFDQIMFKNPITSNWVKR